LKALTSVELVAIAYPMQASLGEVIKGHEIEVARDAMD